jgi:hypothetical protein
MPTVRSVAARLWETAQAKARALFGVDRYASVIKAHWIFRVFGRTE